MPPEKRALFLSPEDPTPGWGGGGLRSSSLLEYLREHYRVQVLRFDLSPHSRNISARIQRNAVRVLQGVPPLFDRFSGYEEQLARKIDGARYDVAVVEHFWCASYAPLLRKHAARLVLDLHNIESELARSHARAERWPLSWASTRFAESYRKLEQQWLPCFDTVLVASDADRSRIRHKDVHVYPNALPVIAPLDAQEEPCIVFSGNLEYHPNLEAVRWFHREIWPLVRLEIPDLEWRLVGRNPHAVEKVVAGDTRIHLVGPVDDALAEIARAQVCVVPLLSGSGTRFKILEAWASSRAVVSTRMGAEGLGARNGEQLLLAEDAVSFSKAIARVVQDADLRRKLGDAGRALYLEKFTWPVAWKALPF
jgi:glycosyltransferase involved in cell wall biosynthesis